MALGTWEDLIRDALLEISAKGPQDTIDDDENNDSFRRLVGMFDEWALQGLLVPGWAQLSLAITGSNDKATYTIGPADNDPAPDISSAKPLEQIYALDYQRQGNLKAHPLKEVGYLVLAEQRRPYSSTPRVYAWDKSWPLQRIIFDSPTISGDSFVITGRGHFDDIELSNEIDVTMPPGYREAALLNLAVKLAPQFGKGEQRAGGGLTRETIRGARMAKRDLIKRNIGTVSSRLDPALRSVSTNAIHGGDYYQAR